MVPKTMQPTTRRRMSITPHRREFSNLSSRLWMSTGFAVPLEWADVRAALEKHDTN